MVAQCSVVVLLILAMSMCFFSTKRNNWAIAMLPLIALPLVYLGENALVHLLDLQVTDRFTTFAIFIGAVVGCISGGVCSISLFKRNRIRIPYLIVTIGFNLALGLILLNHTLF